MSFPFDLSSYSAKLGKMGFGDALKEYGAGLIERPLNRVTNLYSLGQTALGGGAKEQTTPLPGLGGGAQNTGRIPGLGSAPEIGTGLPEWADPVSVPKQDFGARFRANQERNRSVMADAGIPFATEAMRMGMGGGKSGGDSSGILKLLMSLFL